jgi:hypothetical protein
MSYGIMPLFVMAMTFKFGYWIAIVLALLSSVVIFLISGEKFQLVNLILLIYVTRMLHRYKFLDMGKIVLFIIALVFLGSIEIFLYSEKPFNFITDLGIRRIFLSQPLILEHAVQFLDNPAWTFSYGSDFGKSYSSVVGEIFFGIPQYNTNASVFHLSLLGGGLLEFFIQYFLLFIYMALLQYGYASHNNTACQIIAFYLSILSLEQPFTTMLTTSGFAFLLLLSLITWEKKDVS